MRRIFAISLFCAGTILAAHDIISTKITWTREVSRIMYSRCVACHRDGGSSFSLATYTAARPWAKAIKDEVLERRMPPWGALRGFGDFVADPGLNQEEMDTIAQWVEGGAPEGDPALLPKLPAPGTNFFKGAPAGNRISVTGECTLPSRIVLLAIEPSGDVPNSARITATKPDGRIEPLLWVYAFRRRFAHAFVYRETLPLRAGTRIESRPAIPFTLITAAPTPAH